jgi:hypothetical protein
MSQAAIREIDRNDAATEIAAAESMSDFQAGPAVGRARQRMEDAHRRLRVMHAAPVKAFDYWFDEAKREAAGRSAQGQLLVFLKASLKFERWITHTDEWPGSKFSEDLAHSHATAAAGGAQLAAMGLQFNAHAFIGALRSRGVMITVNAFGKVSCSPATLLNATDRETLASPEKRRAILAALGDVAEFGP